MLKRYLFIGVLSALNYAAGAQGNGPGIRGARAAALGNASVALADGWAMGNNVAGLGQLTQPFVGVYAENRYLLRALSNAALLAAVPLGAPREGKSRHGAVGVEVQRFGDKLYSEQRLGTGYGYRGGLFSIGARLDVLQVSIEGLGSRHAVAVSLGGQAEVVPRRLSFGAYLYNLNQSRLARYADERVPTVLKAGLSYRPADKVLLNVETEKDVEQSADFKAGLEYEVVAALAIRAGFASLTQQTTAGVGLQAGLYHLDYAAAWQSGLGLSQHLSVGLEWTKAR
jgi:hypothetical protein